MLNISDYAKIQSDIEDVIIEDSKQTLEKIQREKANAKEPVNPPIDVVYPGGLHV